MTIKSYLYDRFYVSNRNFTTEHVKIVKNFRFFQLFVKSFSYFFFNFSNSKNFQIFLPKLSNFRFQGEVATLIYSCICI